MELRNDLAKNGMRPIYLLHPVMSLKRDRTEISALHKMVKRLFVPKGFAVLNYFRDRFETVRPPTISEDAHIQKMKKYMNYVGMGIKPTGDFSTPFAA